MKETDQVRTEIRGFIYHQFALARRHNLADDGLLLGTNIVDSIGMLDIVSFIEKQFQIVLSDEDLTPENFQSIAAISMFVETKLKGRSAAEEAS